MKKLLRAPALTNRALMAVGKAFCTGDTSEIDDLRAKIQSGETKLTRAERRWWRDYAMGNTWKLKRGEHRPAGGLVRIAGKRRFARREDKVERTAALVVWLRQVRAQLKVSPAERAIKHKWREISRPYSLQKRTAERAIRLLRNEKLLCPTYKTLRALLKGRSKRRKKTTI